MNGPFELILVNVSSLPACAGINVGAMFRTAELIDNMGIPATV